jgi:hypothetical protein
MVSHLYQQRFDLPVQTLLNFDNFHAAVSDVPRFFFSGLTADEKSPSGRAWADEMRQAGKLILLTRDPRDVTVSLFFHLTERASPRELRRKRIGPQERLRARSIFQFMTNDRLGLPRVLHFIQQWAEVVTAHPTSLLVTYEALRGEPVTTFTEVARFIDESFTDAEINAAVAFGDFGAMQARERDGFFESERLRPGRTGDPNSLKVRRGKVGGYRDYLTAEEVRVIDDLVDACGYPLRLPARPPAA